MEDAELGNSDGALGALPVRFQDGLADAEGSVGDCNVQPSEVLQGSIKHGLHLLALGHVGLYSEGSPSQPFDGRNHLLRFSRVCAVVDNDVGAFFGQADGRPAADAARGAGDERDFSLDSFRAWLHGDTS